MNKSFSILPIFIFCVTILHSQTRTIIEVGGILSTFHSGEINGNSFVKSEAKSYISYHARISINFILKNRFQIYSGLTYDKRGASFSQIKNADRDNRDIIINYISIPIGISYTLIKVKKISIMSSLGGYCAYAISGKEKGIYFDAGTNSNSVIYNSIQINNSNQNKTLPTIIKPLDWGAQAAISILTRKISLSLEYSAGLNGILSNAKLYDRQYYNRSLGLSLGYQF